MKHSLLKKSWFKLVLLFVTLLLATALTIGLVFGLRPKTIERDTTEIKLKTADVKRPKFQQNDKKRKNLKKSKLEIEVKKVRLL